ncbi:MAG: VOC family protein [Acidobacteriota bacterium]|nr:VOC family protein [Acidobacteriota bacterium]
MAKINPYLNFIGNTEEAFNFYKSVFGGEFSALMRFKDFPAQEESEGMEIADHEWEKIMHIALPIGGGNVLMGTDVLESMSGNFKFGDNISLSLNVDSKEEADTLYAKLSEGGSYLMPPAEAFWGAYFGMCVDKFGVRWMFNYDNNTK